MAKTRASSNYGIVIGDTDRQEILREVYDAIMKEVKYFGSNNCKAITEDKIKFIFKNLGLENEV